MRAKFRESTTRSCLSWLAAGAIIGIGALASSGFPQAARAQGVAPVTLRLATMTDQESSIKAAIERFQNEHPDIRFELELFTSSQTLGSLYATQFQAGNAPDIGYFFAGSGVSGVLTYGTTGMLASLTERAAGDLLPKSFWNGLSTGEQLWGYPTGVAIAGALEYNVDLFQKEGLAPPTTFSELLDACRTLSAAGTIPIAWSPGDGGLSFAFATGIAAITVYSKDPTWEQKRAAGETSFLSSGWRTVFEQIKQMIDANCFSPGAVGSDAPTVISQFSTGRAAMISLPSANISIIGQINPMLNYSLFVFPPDKATDPVGLAEPRANVYAVNANAKEANRLAALDFIDFLARPEESRAYNSASGTIILTPGEAETGDIDLKTYPKLEGVLHALGPDSVKFGDISLSVWPNTEVSQELNDSIAAIFTGQRTIDESLTAMDAAYDKK